MVSQAPPEIRPAARAGMFYPADPVAMSREVQQHLDRGRTAWNADSRENVDTAMPVRAVMLPHAGWRFCGDIIGRGLAGVAIPRRVIVLGPRHTPHGAQLSAPTHTAWQIPGGEVPIDQPMIAALRADVPPLAHENEAHRLEHGSEVLLPFLQRLQPEVRVAPLVLGRIDLATVRLLGEALARRIQDADPPLLVISSDMNHFAPLHENRRRDQLALGAFASGDPQRLVTTCRDEQISMCGVLPAAAVLVAIHTAGPRPDVQLRGYATSAAVTGDTTSVVGYASAVLH